MFVGIDRPNSDLAITVHSSGWQSPDGSIYETGVMPSSSFLNADQARGLASALVEAAAEADGWSGR
jgi:hypothetical protein